MTEKDINVDPFVLLLIDVQKDFWTEEMSKAFPDYEKNLSTLLEFCRRKRVEVVHLRALFRADKSDWMARYKLGDWTPCIEGTAGAEVFPSARENPGEKVIIKRTFDSFQNPDLVSHLRQNKKQFVLVAGLVTSVCVLFTAASAAQKGFLVGVIEDCCADEPDAHGQTLERYPFVFSRTTVDTISSDLEKWKADITRLAGR